MLLDPLLNAWHDISSAVAELEHAESIAKLGPWKLKNQLIRLASILGPTPLAI